MGFIVSTSTFELWWLVTESQLSHSAEKVHIKLWVTNQWWLDGIKTMIALDNIKSHLAWLETDLKGEWVWVTIMINAVHFPFDYLYLCLHVVLYIQNGTSI